MRAAFILFLPVVAAVAPLQTLPGRRGTTDSKEVTATAREAYLNGGRLPVHTPLFVKIAVASASSVTLRPFLDQHRAVVVRLRFVAWALVALYGIFGLQHIPDLIASLLTAIIVTNPNFSPMRGCARASRPLSSCERHRTRYSTRRTCCRRRSRARRRARGPAARSSRWPSCVEEGRRV